jgi:alpha-tubulin suppressor-like RCC1 family protein
LAALVFATAAFMAAACDSLDGLSNNSGPTDGSCGESCTSSTTDGANVPIVPDAGSLADVFVPNCKNAPDDPKYLDDATMLASGAIHSCVITKDKRVACWGNSPYVLAPALDDAGMSVTTTLTPRFIPGLTGAVKIATGYSSACVVNDVGRVLCWGYNYSGALGNGDGDASVPRMPAPVVLQNKQPITNAVDVVMGFGHACALLQGGAVACWGETRAGQVGPSPAAVNADGFVPYAVAAIGGGVSELAAGATHTCAIRSNATLECWGTNASGQLGSPAVDASSAEPVVLSLAPVGGAAAAHVFAGVGSSCAVDVNGRVFCWGTNSQGQLGQLGVGSFLATPAVGPVLDKVTHVGLGGRNACYVLETGVATCLGSNNIGELGRGTSGSSETNLKPVVENEAGTPFGPVQSISIIKIPIGVGGACGLVRRCGGGTRAYCWGNGAAQGSGENTASSIPKPVLAPF